MGVARIILLPTTMLASEQTPERKRSAPGTPITHARRAETAGINRRQRKRTGAHEVITLDVRVKGGSRPMQFPLRSSVRDIIDTICTYHYFEDDNNISLYSMRSGIWMAPNRTLASYWLDNLEEVLVSEKHDKTDTVRWCVMLPNGQVEDVNGTTRTTTRGIIQLIPLKPENFQFDSAELYIRDQSLEGGWRLLPSDNSLLGLQGQTPDDTMLRLLTPDVDWDGVCLKRLGSLNPSFSTGDLEVPSLASNVTSTYVDDQMSDVLLNEILDQMEHQEFVSRNRILPSPVESLPRAIEDTSNSERSRSSSNPTKTMRRSSSHEKALSPRKSENLLHMFSEYPAFEDLLQVANAEREAKQHHIPLCVPPNEQTNGTFHPARVALTQGEIRLKVLVEFTSKVCEVICDTKAKVSTLVHMVLEQIEVEAENNVNLFLPAQKAPVPFSSTLKSLGLRDEDLLILASKQSTSFLKRRKPKAKAKPLNLIPRVSTLVREGPPAPRSYNRFESPINSPDRSKLESMAVPFGDTTRNSPPEVRILEKFVSCLLSLDGVTTEGIFRMSASSRIVDQVLEKALASSDHRLDVHKVHEVACALKKYLRESQPIIPDSVKAALIATHDGNKVDEQQVHTIFATLPSDSLQCFRVLLPFLYSISEHSHINLMGLPNLSIIFSPIFLQDPLFDIARATMFAEITGALITTGALYCPPTPPVPSVQSDSDPDMSEESPEQKYAAIQELLGSENSNEKQSGIHRAQTLLQDSSFVEYLQSQSPVLLVLFLQTLADCAASLVQPPAM